MEKFLKNLEYSEVFKLADQVDYLKGQVVSKTLTQNSAIGLTLFAMTKGEGISAHKSTGDAFIYILEGRCQVLIEDSPFELDKGESIIMPAGKPHAVTATDDFKMLLIVVFPPK